jgi:hypothetical protein
MRDEDDQEIEKGVGSGWYIGIGRWSGMGKCRLEMGLDLGKGCGDFLTIGGLVKDAERCSTLDRTRSPSRP